MDRASYERLEAVFEEVVELVGEAQGTRLDELCGDDTQLRADVERLLSRDRREHVLAVAPGGLERVLQDNGETSAAPPTTPPTRIGRYHITGRIAEGGMGAVYLAEQEHPRRQVALKVIHSALVSDATRRRFRFEAELLGRLQHPGIAQILEAGEAQGATGSQPYFAMEYIRGPELREYVRLHDLDAAERLELVARICDAVSHAHQKGIVHRDLKPTNVLVVEEDTTPPPAPVRSTRTRFRRLGQPKVLDFGVSCLAPDRSPDTPKLTLPGHVLGTPAYMSPEQAAGERLVDTRSDVYSLGVIAFELLTGHLPHPVEDTPLVQALRRVQETPAPRLESIDPTLRGDVSVIVGKALESDRERRYASAAALAEDIRRYLADEPVTARPPTVSYQLRRFVRRNKLLVGGALVALLGLVVGLVLALLSQREEARQREVADQRTHEAQHLAYAAQLQAALALGVSGDREAARIQLASTAPELRAWEATWLGAWLEDDLWRIPMEVPPRPDARPTPGEPGVLFPVSPRKLRLLDFATGAWSDHACPESPRSNMGAVALLPGGRSALWGGSEGRLCLLDLEGEAPPVELPARAGQIEAIQVAAGGQLAAILARQPGPERSTELLLLDVPSLEPIASWQDAPTACTLAFSPDAALLALGLMGAHRNVLLLDGRTLQHVRTLQGHENALSALCFSPDGRVLATASHDLTIRTWDLTSGEPLRTLGPLRFRAESLVFHSDGERLVSGHGDSRIRTWDLGTGECLRTTSGHLDVQGAKSNIRQLGLDPRGEVVRAVGLDGVRVRPLGPAVPDVLSHDRTLYPFVSAVAFAPSGRYLASAGWDGTVRIWDAATRDSIATLDCPVNVLGLEFSPDGERLLVNSQLGYQSPIFRLLDTRTWTILGELRADAYSGGVLHVSAANAAVVAVASMLWVADPRTLAVRDTIDTGSRVWSLARSPRGETLACGLGDGRVLLLDAASLTVELELAAHGGPVRSLAFSPDGQRLATGADDEQIALWQLPGGAPLVRFDSAGSQHLLDLQFTPDGQRLLSGSRRDSIGIWDPESGRELLRLAGHDAYVVDLDFSPDGRVLASASGDNTVRLWDTRPLRERFEERDRMRAAERAVSGRVQDLLRGGASAAEVLDALDTDPDSSPLERHAAWVLVHAGADAGS